MQLVLPTGLGVPGLGVTGLGVTGLVRLLYAARLPRTVRGLPVTRLPLPVPRLTTVTRLTTLVALPVTRLTTLVALPVTRL
ncbi:MAG TPA: hypothetical protein VGP05_19890, partial [Pseudonocardia sp.]|nr:hypothetical protein [Pseudonocardia sp.]